MNQGISVRHFATSLVMKNDRKPEAGEMVKRRSDSKLFKVEEANAFGIRLEGETGYFSELGFAVV